MKSGMQFRILDFQSKKNITWAYSWPSSLKINSLFSASFSFLPRRLFFPPFPEKRSILNMNTLYVYISQRQVTTFQFLWFSWQGSTSYTKITSDNFKWISCKRGYQTYKTKDTKKKMVSSLYISTVLVCNTKLNHITVYAFISRFSIIWRN